MDDQELFANLAKDFHELVSNKEELRTSVEHFFDNLVDEFTLGVIFDEHRKFKTGAHDYFNKEKDEDVAEVPAEGDIFNQPIDQKLKHYCACPNCDRSVAAEKFAPHLASCMRIGRTRPSRQRTSSSSSEDQESGTSSCQGPSKHSSVKREKQQHHSKNKDDTASTSGSSGHKPGKKKQYKKSSQESPNEVSSTGISVDTDTMVDSFDQLSVEKIQQYFYMCPKCDCAVDEEQFTPHLASCMIDRCEPNRKECDSTSKSQEYDISLCEGPSEAEIIISSNEHEKENQYSKNKDDTAMTSEHEQGTKKQHKEISQESPNNLSQCDTATMVVSFDLLDDVPKIQQYCIICPKCNCSFAVEKFTPHFASCPIDKCEPSTSKIQEYGTFLDQGPSQDENARDLISSSNREEEKQDDNLSDSDIEIDVVGIEDLPCLLASDGGNNNSVTPISTDIVSNSGLKSKSKRKQKKRVKHSSTFDTNQDICNQPKIQKIQQHGRRLKTNRAVDAERFTSDLPSCMKIGTGGFSSESSSSTSKSQEYTSSLCQGPSKDRNCKDKGDTDLSSGHKQAKKKKPKKSSH